MTVLLDPYHLALQMNTQRISIDCLENVNIYNNIAMIYFKQNEYIEAIKFHHKSLDIQLNPTIFLPYYEMLTISFWNLPLPCYSNKQNSEALDYFQEALAIRKNIFPSEDKLIKNICNMIAYIEEMSYNPFITRSTAVPLLPDSTLPS